MTNSLLKVVEKYVCFFLKLLVKNVKNEKVRRMIEKSHALYAVQKATATGFIEIKIIEKEATDNCVWQSCKNVP